MSLSAAIVAGALVPVGTMHNVASPVAAQRVSAAVGAASIAVTSDAPRRVSALRGVYSTRGNDDACGRVNGRVWESGYSGGCTSGSEHYGVHDHNDTLILVRVGTVSHAISPWERIDEPGLKHLERARNRWLNDHGFTGGVRTFVNDAHARHGHGHDHDHDGDHVSRTSSPGRLLRPVAPDLSQVVAPRTRTILPRATIHVPVEVTKYRSRMRVHRTPTCAPVINHCAPVVVSRCQPCPPRVITVSGHGNTWTPTRVISRRVASCR